MERNPTHTDNTRYYLINRACLWFAKGDKIETTLFQSYFTQKAIKSLLNFGFIQVLNS
jgi:hypothetical protein